MLTFILGLAIGLTLGAIYSATVVRASDRAIAEAKAEIQRLKTQ